MLGSVGVAIYRDDLDDSLPGGVPADAASDARDTLGAAIEAAADLPPTVGDALVSVAREAFVSGMHITATVSAVVAAFIAAVAVVALRSRGPGGTGEADPNDVDAEVGAAEVGDAVSYV